MNNPDEQPRNICVVHAANNDDICANNMKILVKLCKIIIDLLFGDFRSSRSMIFLICCKYLGTDQS